MSMNILLIEEEDDRHAAILGYLEDRHYRVTACRSVAEADKALARLPDRSVAPDAIVSNASGMSFYMKNRQRFPGMRWILTTPRNNALPADPLDAAQAAFAHAGGGRNV